MLSSIGTLWRVLFISTSMLSPAYTLAQVQPDSSHKTRTQLDSRRVLRKSQRDSAASHWADSLKTRAALNPEQEIKVREILKAHHEQTAADQELYRGFPQTLLRAAKERFDKTDKEILALLDANQKKKYALLKKDRLGQREARRSKKKQTGKAQPDSTK